MRSSPPSDVRAPATTARSASPRQLAVAVAADMAAVALFVVVGRRSHDGGLTLSGLLTTAAPFLIGLAAGWLVARAWRAPTAAASGVIVWLVMVVLGLVLRRTLFDDGTALAFVIVTTLTLGALLIGWRLVARGAASATQRRQA